MSVRKNLYIAEDVLHHLESQPNMSNYVNQLIREDMNNTRVLTKADVIKIIEENLPKIYLAETPKQKEEMEDCKAEIAQSVANIFDMAGGA